MEGSLNGWLSLSTDPFKSRHAQLSADDCHSGACVARARNDGLGWVCVFAIKRRHVSTNPVLEPLAMESLCP